MKIFKDFNLENHNSYKLKAVCKTAYFPESDEDIRTLFSEKNDKVLLGGGYNVILSKNYYEEDFVIFSGNYNDISLVEEDSLLGEAGVDMKVLSEFALKHSLSGLEIYYDIPSSLGGAVVMNAGAGGEDMKGLLKTVWYYHPLRNEFLSIDAADIGFEYRNSFFQRNPEMIICRVLLKMQKGEPASIAHKMKATRDARWAKQPRTYPNAGSVFKRPPGKFVGPMIDELGLKGFGIGGAKVSEQHSGFIVNYDNASGEDVLALITYVKQKVKERFQINLEVEQRII